jgi:hypothetical protein
MRTRSALLLSIALAAPAAARADTLALLPATGVNVPADTLAGAQDVFFGHLLATRRWPVKVVPGPAPASGWTPSAAAERAREAGTDLAVALHLTRLDGTTKARLATYRAADGRMAWFDEAAATQPGELDGALQRLAQGLAAGRPAAELVQPSQAAVPTPRVAAAPPPYAPPPMPPGPAAYPPPPGAPPPPEPPRGRRLADQAFGFSFVGAWATGTDSIRSGESSAQGAEAFWLYDTRTVLATVQLSYLGGANHQTAFGMGVYAPLMPGDVAPYLGGGLQFTWSKWWDADAWEEGFTPYLGAGVLFGREWSAQVRVQFGWFYNLYLSRNAAGAFHGQGFTASIGMAF